MTARGKPGEELIDTFVNRPLAALLVKGAVKTPITPNIITLLGMHAGIFAGIFFWKMETAGDHLLALGGLLLFVCMVLDCADGQLARARGGGTRGGRILDGLADYIVGIFVHVGLAMILIYREGYTVGMAWLLTGGAMLSTALQCFLLDHYKARGTGTGVTDELIAAQDDLARARAGDGALADRILLPIYIAYTRIQRSLSRVGRQWQEVREVEKPAQPALLRKLAFVGPSTHNLLIVAAALAGPVAIAPYFAAVIVLGNLYLVWALGSSAR